MYSQETIIPYDAGGAKEVAVEQMFDNIAPTYDKLNHTMSLNIDKRWRRKTVASLQVCESASLRVLDVATGTGDFALLIANTLKNSEVVGIDISEGMLAIARKKAPQLTFMREDCTALSFPDESFDAVTSAFGIRNFQDLDKGLRECYRVLRPGGVLAVCELTTPVHFPMKQLFKFYAKVIIPLQGWILSGDRKAYDYLNRSIAAFPQGETMVEVLKKAGFSEASFTRMSCGLCTKYVARKA